MESPGSLEFREYRLPSPEEGAVLTEVVQANVCGSELHTWRGDHPDVKEGVMGHEGVCRIAELGKGVTTDYAGQPVEEGDLITPVYFTFCQRCQPCLEGQYNLCENAYQYLTRSPDEFPHFHGTFGTHYYVQPDQHFYAVPEEVDPGVAAAANCGLSQMLFSIDRIDLQYDETVVVQGAGGLGLNAIAIACERGGRVIVIDGQERRLERAHEFGADHVIDFREHETIGERVARVEELTDGTGADVGIEVAGVPDAFAEGLELVRSGGRYLEVGNVSPGHTTEIDPGRLTRKSVQIQPVVRYEPRVLRRALKFLSSNSDSYPYHKLIDEMFELTDLKRALVRSSERTVTRAGITPKGS
jgi:threonine dehydrogenase-like Zn-dependent dehydrogenase